MIKNRIITLTANPSIDLILSVDSVVLNDKNIVQETHTFYGGKGTNVAFVLGKLDCVCTATGFVGVKELPLFTEKLSKVNVSSHFTPVPDPTRTNFKIMDTQLGKDTEFNQSGFTVSPEDISTLMTQIKSLLANADWLALCGSLPSGAPDDLYKQAIECAALTGVKTCLDASGMPLTAALQAKPNLLHINRAELEEVTSQKLTDTPEMVSSIKELMDQGIEMIVVSMGQQGVLAGSKGFFYRAEVPAVKVKSLTGAGDALTAGMLFCLSQGESFEEALRFSTALATASTLELEPGNFNRPDLENILSQTNVIKI